MKTAALAASLLASACHLYVGEDDPAPDGPDDSQPLAYCLPQPVTRASDVAPELFQWILDAERDGCHLERRTGGGVIDGFPGTVDTFPAPGTSRCDADGCWTALPAFARAWGHHPPPAAFTPPVDPIGQQWIGMIQAERNPATGELRAAVTAMEYGSTAVRQIERRFAADGRLLEDRYAFGGRVWFTTINTWAGDHLVASRFIDDINGTGITEYSWDWDGDRLLRATATHVDSGSTAVTDWSYDEQGRPRAALRTLDGITWARQDWTYDGDGRLIGSGTELHPGAYQDTYQVRPVDDLEPLVAAATQLEWAAALPPAGTACTGLPHALTYGYPEADDAYALGWPVGDRPPGIDGDYGFGPAYDSSLDRWFGHDRVEGIAWNVPYEVPAVRVDVTYAADGAMISELLTASDDSVRALRTREREDGRVVRDTRVLRRAGDELTTTLSFARDGAGRVVARDYTMNGVHVARHTWSRTAADITRHAIAYHRLFEPGFDQPGIVPTNLDDLPAALPPPVVHERAFSPDGRTVTFLRDGAPLETRTRDAAGRLIGRAYPGSATETYAWDDSGELRSYASSWNNDGTADMLLEYERSATGHVLTRRWAYPQRGDTDQFTYACE